jgi:hypothetical protein
MTVREQTLPGHLYPSAGCPFLLKIRISSDCCDMSGAFVWAER